MPVRGVPQPHLHARRREEPLPGLWPLDEHDRVVEVELEVAPLGVGHAVEAVEVEVRDVEVAAVAVPDRVGRAGDRPLDPERPRRAAHEGRLARSELARDGHDVSGPELAGDPRFKSHRGRVLHREQLGAILAAWIAERSCDEVIAANPGKVAEFKAGNDKVLNWMTGQVMKSSGGKANPKMVGEVLREKIGR